MIFKRTGGCLCGSVKYKVTAEDLAVHVCHCNICQKWDGGPGLSLKCEPGWEITGEDHLTWYDSSEWGQRGFCNKCGSHLFFRLKDGSYHAVTPGTLDNQDGLEINMHIFTDKKPPYYDFTDNSPRLSEEEFLKMIEAGAEA